ncbi:MAG: lysophospholipase [Proteobacteria bacterium]|nr:lysophospholipase [Pseudomonadota bacterium]
MNRLMFRFFSTVSLKPIFTLFLIFIASACTPVVQEPGPIKVSPALNGNYFTTIDGVNLPMKSWKPDGDISGIIIAVHGMNDYRNAFAFPGSWWRSQGLYTFAYDQRGFGETEEIGVWPGEDLMISDLATLVSLVKSEYPTKPLYLLGESMGGAVVLTAIADPEFPDVSGVILSAPAVWGWDSMNIFYEAILRAAAHTFPDTKLTGSGLGVQASDNISVLRNLGADPLFIKGTRIDAVYGLVNLMDSAFESAEKLDLPALLLYGANDELVPREPVEEMVQTLPADANIVIYPDGWHMLMRDLQAPVVWLDIASWVKKREIPSGYKVENLPLFEEDEAKSDD